MRYNFKMESTNSVIFLITIIISFIFEVIAPNTDSETTKYEPLYLTYSSNKFEFVDFQSLKFDLEVACPIPNNPDKLLTVVRSKKGQMGINVGIRCDHRVEPVILKYQHLDHHVIGFLIYKEGGDSWRTSPYYEYQPKTHYPVPLIKLSYINRSPLRRSLTTWHTIQYHVDLKIDYEEPSTQQAYESNKTIYGFFADAAYSPENQRYLFKTHFNTPPASLLVKTQLVPEGDFFLENFKSATRSNINTVPMWQVLVPQWRQLEKLVRKLVQIIPELRIITGAADVYTTSGPLFLYHSYDLPVPKFIWKGVTYHQKYQNKWHYFGIIFVMLNDPYKLNKEIICSESIAEDLGWPLLQQVGTLESPMYACPMTQDNLKLLQVHSEYSYEDFNLNVVKVAHNVDSVDETVVDIDVAKELKKF